MFDKAKMIAQAFRLKKAVEAEMVEIEENGIVIKVTGDQKIKYLSINGVENKALVDTINKILKKSQEVAAKKMKDMGGLDGLF
ncbi:MAG: hypothetical protein UU09_C0037G0014 [Microgenomates group bacterium GW2011_GWA2_40_6]|nr:MAG: hypothetical protein UU09_C0037G0014 [Microgenomates group bacterium GW2011_GWA2_40_6]